MKTATLLSIVVALSAMFAAPRVQAQADSEKAPSTERRKAERAGRGNPEQQVAALDRAVGGLSEEQKSKINALVGKRREELQALPREERAAKAREVRTGQREEIRALLTEEQKAKFDAMPQRATRDRDGEAPRKKKKNR